MKTFIILSRTTFSLILSALISIPSFAQIKTSRIDPESLPDLVRFHDDFQAREITMPPVDVTELLKEDEEQSDLPPRFGKALKVDLGLDDGSWEETDLGRIWKLSIRSPGAFSVNLKFDRFFLPDSAELYIYNKERTMIMGPITSKVNKPKKGLATDLIQGDAVVLELFEPARHSGKTELHISRVVHGYKNMFGGEGEFYNVGYGASSNCHNDINCQQGNNWQEEAAAVAMVLIDQNTR